MLNIGVLLAKKAEKKEKKKINIQGILLGAITLAGGYFIGWFSGSQVDSDATRTEKIFQLVMMFICIALAVMLQTVIHEAGHLIFGRLTGYEFVSFRVGSFMLIKDNGKIKFKRYSLAGTGGQCLMSPPDMVDGKCPVFWYNMGGSLLNIITAVICIVLYFVFKDIKMLSILFIALAAVGIFYGLLNGIPIHSDMINNDGYNALELSKDTEALRSLWIQLKANAEITKGRRLKDMPAEWFEVPSKEGMKNSMVATLSVFAANRLMDEHRFEEAYKLMDELLSADTGIVDIHRNLLISDCIFCEAIAECSQDIIGKMMTKDLKKFCDAMKDNPSIIRTQYTYALLVEKDTAKALKIKEHFEKIRKTYPYPSEHDTEGELMQLVDRIYNERESGEENNKLQTDNNVQAM